MGGLENIDSLCIRGDEFLSDPKDNALEGYFGLTKVGKLAQNDKTQALDIGMDEVRTADGGNKRFGALARGLATGESDVNVKILE